MARPKKIHLVSFLNLTDAHRVLSILTKNQIRAEVGTVIERLLVRPPNARARCVERRRWAIIIQAGDVRQAEQILACYQKEIKAPGRK